MTTLQRENESERKKLTTNPAASTEEDERKITQT